MIHFLLFYKLDTKYYKNFLKSKEHDFKHCQLYTYRWSARIGGKYKWANDISDR